MCMCLIIFVIMYVLVCAWASECVAVCVRECMYVLWMCVWVCIYNMYVCVYYVYGCTCVCMYTGACSCEFMGWVACCSIRPVWWDPDPLQETQIRIRRWFDTLAIRRLTYEMMRRSVEVREWRADGNSDSKPCHFMWVFISFCIFLLFNCGYFSLFNKLYLQFKLLFMLCYHSHILVMIHVYTYYRYILSNWLTTPDNYVRVYDRLYQVNIYW